MNTPNRQRTGCDMNRRKFLQQVALSALMATPPMRALAFAKEFGLPNGEKYTGKTISTFYVDGSFTSKLGAEELFMEVGSVGSSWDNPFRTLSEAITAERSGDTLHIRELDIGMNVAEKTPYINASFYGCDFGEADD